MDAAALRRRLERTRAGWATLGPVLAIASLAVPHLEVSDPVVSPVERALLASSLGIWILAGFTAPAVAMSRPLLARPGLERATAALLYVGLASPLLGLLALAAWLGLTDASITFGSDLGELRAFEALLLTPPLAALAVSAHLVLRRRGRPREAWFQLAGFGLVLVGPPLWNAAVASDFVNVPGGALAGLGLALIFLPYYYRVYRPVTRTVPARSGPAPVYDATKGPPTR